MLDYSKLITEIFSALWYVIPLAILLGVIKSSWFKGIVGEFIINTLARAILDKEKYHLIKNVTLPTENGSTQIDHVIVSKYGLFVVETKNMKGWIFGSEHQKKWTQQIFKYRKQFQNPLHQNYKHTKTLAKLLILEESKLHSLVVFIGSSTFKTAMPANVTQGFGYVKYIKSQTSEVLTKAETQTIIESIENNRLERSFKTNRDHVNHVRQLVDEREKIPCCPKCQAAMVLRESKKGKNIGNKFWGCIRYPQCRGTVNVE